MRLKLPANHQVSVHYHLSVENITVISGAVRLVYGDKLDKSKLFKAGSFISIPEEVKHFAMTADSKAIVQLNNLGPWEVNYLDPNLDPRKQ